MIADADTDLIAIEPFEEFVTDPERMREQFREAWEIAALAIQAGMAVELIARPVKKTRSIEANAALWAHLTDIARQVVWFGEKLAKAEWKDVLSSTLRKAKVVPGIDGGFVVLGMRTSKMSIREMSNLIELCLAFGAQQKVRFTAPKWMWDQKGK